MTVGSLTDLELKMSLRYFLFMLLAWAMRLALTKESRQHRLIELELIGFCMFRVVSEH